MNIEGFKKIHPDVTETEWIYIEWQIGHFVKVSGLSTEDVYEKISTLLMNRVPTPSEREILRGPSLEKEMVYEAKKSDNSGSRKGNDFLRSKGYF